MDISSFVDDFVNLFDDMDPDVVTVDTFFRDMDQWDSLTTMAFMNMVSMKYGKALSVDEMMKCQTVSDLYKIISE